MNKTQKCAGEKALQLIFFGVMFTAEMCLKWQSFMLYDIVYLCLCKTKQNFTEQNFENISF